MDIGPDTSAELSPRLSSILTRYDEVAAAYLFGSCARGTASATSDVDLGLLLVKGHRIDDLALTLGDLGAQLDRLVAPRHVDLVVLDTQGPAFCHQVLVEGLVVHEADRDRRIDFESETIVRALDFRPTLELATRGYVQGFRSWLRSYRDRQRRATPA
jgi:predicted nucleotidyltransferase